MGGPRCAQQLMHPGRCERSRAERSDRGVFLGGSEVWLMAGVVFADIILFFCVLRNSK